MSEPSPQPSPDQPADTPKSSGLSRRHLFMGGALLAVSGIALARNPERRYPNLTKAQYDSLFPRNFAGWTTLPVSELVLPPEGGLSAELYQHILTRTYTNSAGVGVMFLAAYNSEQINNVQVHRPEICYAASGFDIDLSKPYNVVLDQGHIIPARTVEATRDARIENILYWTRIGQDFPQSWVGQRIAMTKANIEGYLADGILYRASVLEADNKQAMAVLSQFARDMKAHTSPLGRRIIFGMDSAPAKT